VRAAHHGLAIRQLLHRRRDCGHPSPRGNLSSRITKLLPLRFA
jgi:hypothetical protein